MYTHHNFFFRKFQQRLPYDLLSALANALLDDTAFEIVKGLEEVQHLEEKSLWAQRMKLVNDHKCEFNMPYPFSERQLKNMRAVFGRGVKKRNGCRLAGNPADFVNTLAGEFWVSLRMVNTFYSGPTKLGTLRFFPPRPKYAEIFL